MQCIDRFFFNKRNVACGNAPEFAKEPISREAEIRFLFDNKDLDDFEEYKRSYPETIYRISDFEMENVGNVTDSSTRIGYYITLK